MPDYIESPASQLFGLTAKGWFQRRLRGRQEVGRDAYWETGSGVDADPVAATAPPATGAGLLADLGGAFLTVAFVAFAGAGFFAVAFLPATLVGAFLAALFAFAGPIGAFAAVFFTAGFLGAAFLAVDASGAAAAPLRRWNSAHRFFCAAAIRRRAAGLSGRLRAVAGVVGAAAGFAPPPSRLKISAIFCWILANSAS